MQGAKGLSALDGIWALLPVKNIEDAKQRLAPTLTPDERQNLFQAMVEDVLETLVQVPGLAGVLMVTCDTHLQGLAKQYGVHILVEPANKGHTQASTFGACTLANEGADGMIQVPGDLPALQPDDIAAMLHAHGEAPSVTIAPSSDDRGSNAIACSPPDFLPFRFGNDSFLPHCSKARELGVEPIIVKRHGLGLDIDTPRDLQTFLARPAKGRTLDYLLSSGIARRIRDVNLR